EAAEQGSAESRTPGLVHATIGAELGAIRRPAWVWQGGKRNPVVSGISGAGGPPGTPPVDLGIPGIVETEEIGRGGFAVVYRGRRQGFDQSVAVKVLAAALDYDSRQRFDREVRAMGALFGHPFIVGIITAGFTVADRPYIVMEDMTGGSLADALRKRGPYGWEDAAKIGDGLPSALEAAHSAHVLHCDVK